MDETHSTRARGAAGPSRERFLRAAAATAGLAVLPAGVASPVEAAADVRGCGESVQDILNAALAAEQLATAFYYTGLTTRAIAGVPAIAGASADPNNVSPDGNRANVAYLQAALDQEQKHAQILANAGAVSPYQGFYFPASTFERLGFTSHRGTYLSVLDHLETTFISAYIAAVRRFATLGRADLVTVALRFLGVECQHRALYRVISGDDPADNVTIEVGQVDCVGDAAGALAPYLSGRGLPGATTKVALPSPAAVARVVGRNASL